MTGWLLFIGLDSVTSPSHRSGLGEPKPRECVHDVCVFVCECVLRLSRVLSPLNLRYASSPRAIKLISYQSYQAATDGMLLCLPPTNPLVVRVLWASRLWSGRSRAQLGRWCTCFGHFAASTRPGSWDFPQPPRPGAGTQLICICASRCDPEWRPALATNSTLFSPISFECARHGSIATIKWTNKASLPPWCLAGRGCPGSSYWQLSSIAAPICTCIWHCSALWHDCSPKIAHDCCPKIVWHDSCPKTACSAFGSGRRPAAINLQCVSASNTHCSAVVSRSIQCRIDVSKRQLREWGCRASSICRWHALPFFAYTLPTWKVRIQWQRCSLRTVSNRRVSCVYLGSLLPDHVLVVLGTWVLLHVITRDVLCANRMGRTLFGASATSATEIGPAILCYGQEVNVCICTHAHYVCMYTQSKQMWKVKQETRVRVREGSARISAFRRPSWKRS